MKSPSGSNGISHDWVEFVVQQQETKSQPGVAVKLISFSVAAATKPGENFNSELVRVDACAELSSGGSKDDSPHPARINYNFIVKFLSADPFNREMVKALGQHVNELMMYSKLVGELNAYWETNASCLEADQKIHAPKFIHGAHASSEYVLVLENCKESNFETNDKRKGLDSAQMLLAVDQLARLHALSRSFNLSTDIGEKYPCFAYNAAMSTFMKPLGSIMLECVAKYMKTLPEHKDIVAKLEKGRLTASRKFDTVCGDPSQHKMMCLTHGDFWNNNLLFRYHSAPEGGERKLEAVKVIDWQLTRWNNPMFDLHYLINSSTAAKVRDDHLEDILRHYHSTFTSISENVKTPVPEWDYDAFRAEYGRTASVGLLIGLCTLQGSLSKAGEKLAASNSNSPPSQKSVSYKFKTAVAKAMIPLALKPSFQFINKSALKKMLSPITKELIDGQNTVLNERFLDLILEADRKGLLDDLCL